MATGERPRGLAERHRAAGLGGRRAGNKIPQINESRDAYPRPLCTRMGGYIFDGGRHTHQVPPSIHYRSPSEVGWDAEPRPPTQTASAADDSTIVEGTNATSRTQSPIVSSIVEARTRQVTHAKGARILRDGAGPEDSTGATFNDRAARGVGGAR